MAFVDQKGLNIKVVYHGAEPALLCDVMRKLRAGVDPAALGTVLIEPNAQGLAAFEFVLPPALAVRGKPLRVHAYGAPLGMPADKLAILMKGADAGVFVLSEEGAGRPETEAAWFEFMGQIFTTYAAIAAAPGGKLDGVRGIIGTEVPIVDGAGPNPGHLVLKPVLRGVLAVIAP